MLIYRQKRSCLIKNNDISEHIKAYEKMTHTLNNQIQEFQKYICSKSAGNPKVNSITSVFHLWTRKLMNATILVMIIP